MALLNNLTMRSLRVFALFILGSTTVLWSGRVLTSIIRWGGDGCLLNGTIPGALSSFFISDFLIGVDAGTRS